MLAISLWQPYASLIAFGFKQYETRSWRPNWCNERIAIHAAKRWPRDRRDYTNSLIRKYPQIAAKITDKNLVFGCIVATAYLSMCLPTTTVLKSGISELEQDVGDWSAGRWAWKLEDVQIIEPVPVIGRQGFFHYATTK